jgi:ferredoxin
MARIHFTTTDQVVTFADGDEVNLLRIAIRHECGIPYRCASGNCGTDRVRVLEGVENCLPPRRRERDRLGDLLDQGYRLACQTYVAGDVSVAWDPDQTALPDRAAEQLKRVWLAKDDTA